MKSIISLLMIVCFANFTNAQSQDDYDKLWKEVEAFEKEGLPKSALDVVKRIEQKAKSDDNSAQEIKTLLFRSKYALTLEEDAQLKIVNDFKAAISSSDIPDQNILENILATLYWQYFNQNRWKFYNRTKTSEKVDETDFRTWDLETLFHQIHVHYQNSLQNGLILQKTDLTNYDAIVINQTDSKRYRPSVFDILAHNALQFYKSDENSITQPAYKFEIDNPETLSSADRFSRLDIKSKDSTSLQLHALKIYQSLVKFHLKDEASDALAVIDIERLHYVHSKATFKEKGDLFLMTLETAYTKYQSENNDVAALYAYEIAEYYHQLGVQYEANTNEKYRWKLKEAITMCNTVIADYPKSTGAHKCRLLKTQIESPTLQVITENYVPTQSHALALITYKNLDSIGFKVSKISEYELQTLRAYNHDSEKELQYIKKFKPVKKWTSHLKNESDYQSHRTEIALPKLDNGIYVVFGEVMNDSNIYGFKVVQVTNIAYVQKEHKDQTTYQVFDRIDGQPLSQAKVTFIYSKNYQNKLIKEQYTTNAQGEFTIPKTDYSRSNIKLNILYNNEEAIFENLYLNRYYNYDNSNKKIVHDGFIFSDRSIYRPGQTLYFKGIVINNSEANAEVVANSTVAITLYNKNREVLKTQSLKTNAYGSVAGEFILPNQGLLGNYSIRMTGENNLTTHHYISVEEYKRPKFEANFKPITNTFKVNDTVVVTGHALAYAGSNITDAKVVYRVHRNVRYPDWYYWYRPYFNSEPQEITHGEITTDASGNFEIKFKAIPDKSVDKSSLPIFNYEITADVTDLNGETRSATTTVNVGYHALKASVSIASVLDKTNNDHKITIATKNLNGSFVPTQGTVKIYKLKAPNSVLRTRPWPAPDYQEFTKEEFKSLFPHQAYKDENDSKRWDKGDMILSKTFDTEDSKTLDLGNMKRWDSGTYRILLETKDRFGQLVKDEAQTFIYSDKDDTLADHQIFNITTDKSVYSKDDTVEITLASAAKELYVTIEIEKNHNIVDKRTILLNNNKKTISIPVRASDLGGFGIHYFYAFQNDFGQGNLTINVPYPKTELEIETATFRDKLQPGTDETWSFKIKGPKGDQVTAELLASMYDMSLDQFKSHEWRFDPMQRPYYYPSYRVNVGNGFATGRFSIYNIRQSFGSFPSQRFDQFNLFGLRMGFGNAYYLRGRVAGLEIVEDESVMEEVVVAGYSSPRSESKLMNAVAMDSVSETGLDDVSKQKDTDDKTKAEEKDFGAIKVRKNLQETAFFFPQLTTDADGHVSFSFTTPEALSKWKLQLLAHTKSLESATTTLEAVTQKELMVLPNVPRFLREGDQITISSKISNVTEKALNGHAKLILTDAISGKDITRHMGILPTGETVQFSVDAKGNTDVSWSLNIPFDVDAVQYKILAKAGDFSDGEQNALPILSNRMLVTETLPMWVKSNETRTFTLDKLKNNTSTSLKHHQLSFEVTSNPAWYAVQALPYLMEYPYDCNEQTFSRYYANALASHIANTNPRIQEVFNQWKNTDALVSNLEKNQELKSILIEETPWLRDAQDETEQKKRIALLFDLNKMSNELTAAHRKLKNGQMPNGAWAWFNGGRPNRYITQHIVAGFGHLDKLGVTTEDHKQMIDKAIHYLDSEFIEDYKNLKKYNKEIDLSKDHLSYIQLHYLYTRSFFPDNKPSKEVQKIMDYYHTQIEDYWLKRSLYAKGLMVLVTHRKGNERISKSILKSLRETSITSEELGMYWKNNTSSWYWHQAPIETQALMIEAFSEVEGPTETIDNLKIWLLKNKQTNRWKTTKATTEAVYALLLQGSDWLSVTEMVDVSIGGQALAPSQLENVKIEAGTGYYKTSWTGSEIEPDMATVKMTKKGKGIAWGSLYWQYFEDLDKITSAETPLKLSKKLFKKTHTDRGEEITEITSETSLEVGDLVRVRIELRSDRVMEFLHMKDMRAAGLEPVNVLSQYKWQDGLGYYESTKDASTNFFFDYLPKGIYVFEYDLRVQNAGDMSNGITTIQSMYAPEFSSHSKGDRLKIN
ncbi:MAG: alpha-2-macroglobulin [Algicola sp.]|nr:alpha-2-macroglobulin [Algicola sp.]